MPAVVGQNTDVDTAAEALVASSTKIQQFVRIKAGTGNSTNIIYVGFSNSVSATNGYPTQGR